MGAIVSVCCAVGRAHRRGTFLEPSTTGTLALKKNTFGFQSTLDFRISDKSCRAVICHICMQEIQGVYVNNYVF
jgi:hypothetical protein